MGLEQIDDHTFLLHALHDLLKIDLIIETLHVVGDILAEVDFRLV